MQIEHTKLEGCFLVRDTVFGDDRGFFFESYNRRRFLDKTGLDIDFVQDNQSLSQKGTLRGLHFQHGDAAQAKLVRVLKGKVLDVAVDLRRNSDTFGQHVTVELAGDSGTQLFVPRGFAHAFLVLSDTAIFFYKCDNYYNKSLESGIIYNDTDLAIDWKLDAAELVLSEKDKALPTLKSCVDTLNF
jgi:dTDP-4-dehydrorhamnose 3,5-epimerase